MKTLRTSQAGLTLVEIIVVLAILGMIMAFVGRAIFSRGEKAKYELNRLQMEKVKSHIGQYQLRYNNLPPSLQSLLSCDQNTGPGCLPIADSADDLKDAWGTPFIYATDGSGRSYSLKSLGADRREGGTDVNTDPVITGP